MATAEAIFLADQEDIWAPFVDRWFDEMLATTAFRTNAALAAVATASFPHLAVSARTVERAEALLAREDLPPGLRRVVADATDDLRRAVAVRPPAP